MKALILEWLVFARALHEELKAIKNYEDERRNAR